MLTGTAAILTAATGLVVGLYQTGVLGENNDGAAPGQVELGTSIVEQSPSEEASGMSSSRLERSSATSISSSESINLLAKENGGKVLVASSDSWLSVIDGDESSYGYISGEGVYAFEGERSALFDMFALLVHETSSYNVKEFELLASSESPTGRFRSIGKFEVLNAKMFTQPYQEFRFPVVEAKYLKVKILSTYGASPVAYEFQLMGRLADA